MALKQSSNLQGIQSNHVYQQVKKIPNHINVVALQPTKLVHYCIIDGFQIASNLWGIQPYGFLRGAIFF